MNTKRIWNITESNIANAFINLGIPTLIPWGDTERYDLVVEVNHKFYRIQCKTSRLSKGVSGVFSFPTQSLNYHEGRKIRYGYSKDDIDFFATFWNQKAYLVPVELTNQTREFGLRFEPPRNNQKTSRLKASDFELQNVVEKMMGDGSLKSS